MVDTADKDELRKLYERGVPVKVITQVHAVSRQTISKYAKRFGWSHPRYKRVSTFEKIDRSTKKSFRERLAEQKRMQKLHHQEFQVVRRILQSAIDHENLETATLAKQISETLILIHHAELKQISRIDRNSSEGKIGEIRPKYIPREMGAFPNTLNPDKITKSTADASLTIMELFERWKRDRSNLASSTASHWRKALTTFIEFIGHSDPLAVSRDDTMRWRDWLMAQNYARKTIESSYLGAPRAIYNYALTQGLVEQNPFRSIQLPKQKIIRKRSKSYSDEEARTILRASIKLQRGREKEHVYNLRKWGPWLAAFTGARINEICQLRKQDIQQKNGIWCIHITPDAGPVKSKLDRLIPLHPQLIDIGFINFIQKMPSGYIFSHNVEASRARDRSKLISVWVRSLGISDKEISPNHAWRHRFKTICRHAGIQTEYQNAITGHANEQNVGFAYGEFPVSALYREICKLPRYLTRS